MSAQSRIPLTIDVSSPDTMRRDLERQAAALEDYHGLLTGPQQNAVVPRKPTKRRLNDQTAAFGEFTPVALPNETDVHRVALPRPDPRNAGLVATVVRRTTTGTVLVSSPGCTINGFTAVELLSALGWYEFRFDGENYFTTPGAVWGVP